MDYNRFKELVESVPDYMQKDYRNLKRLVGIGDDVWPLLKQHLEDAETLYDFFENIYYDDACRMEKAWGYWARWKHPHDWPLQFEPLQEQHGISYAGAIGFIMQTEGMDMMIPIQTRGGVDKQASIYVFEDDCFNDEAVDYMFSFGGKAKVENIQLDGSYDVYRADGLLVFEQWVVDDIGRRANKKRQIWGENPNKFLYA